MKSCITRCLLAFILFSFVSCSKELSKEHGTVPVNGDFYATIDGNQWDADSLQLVFASNGGVSINGLSKTGGQISMILPTFKTGIYIMNANSDSYAYYTNILTAVPIGYLSNAGTATGTVTISNIDTVNHQVSGSFSFTLINPVDNTSKSVTQGIFYNLPYSGNAVVINPPPTGNGTDTLKCTIDGTSLFNAAQVAVQSVGLQLTISGVSGDGLQHMELLMPVNITPGSYPLDFSGTSTYGAAYYTDIFNPLLSLANGTLDIISNDASAKRITGTFSFKATSLTDTQSADITSGYFSVNY
jgi:hypothetical protein